MLNGSMHHTSQRSGASRITLVAIIGCAAFAGGIGITAGVVKFTEQKEQTAQMSQSVVQMSGQRADVPNVTRQATADLLRVAAPQNAPEPALVQILSQPAPAPLPAAAPVAAVTASPADEIRALVSANVAAPQTVPAALDAEALANARKFETLATIQAGVEELVSAVVEGRYEIHTNYEDEDFSGRIHFAFVGHEKDQVALERLLANAAEEGIVKHSAAVVDGNGRVNGHILLFDLVERALENGTVAERRAGAQMARKAREMLEKDVIAGEPETAEGEKFYVVEAGDSLAYIALQFYGNINDYTRIYEANRSQISRPDIIRVGQRLLIPKA